jgi:ATP-dependent helicase/nuclease subunit A
LLFVDHRHKPEFAKWLTTPADESATADKMVATWKSRFDRDKDALVARQIAEKAPVTEMQRLLAVATPGAGNTEFVDAIATLSDFLSRAQIGTIKESELETISKVARVQGLCKAGEWPTPRDFDAYKKVCEEVRNVVKKCRALPWNEVVAREVAVLGLKLLRLAGQVADEYERRKDAQSLVDFDDQLALTHRLLTDPKNEGLCDYLSSDLRLVLVDEFQDTDPLQVELIKKICGAGFDEGRLFFVGDFKQSIYRFRGAVPRGFRELREGVPDNGRLKLTENFRSQPGILHFVNALFAEEFPDEALQPHRKPANNAPVVEFLWTLALEREQREQGQREADRRAEAIALAQRLRELVDENCLETPVVDKTTGQPRRAKPGDIAILFRALSDVRLYEEALRESGLEYYLVGGHAFYAQQEIFDVLNLLRAIGSAADDVSLAGVLRSPFFGLADETLFWLREHACTLNEGLLAERLPVELSDEERANVSAAAAAIRHLRAIKDRVQIADVMNEAIALTGYDAVLLAEFLGERKLANLQKLIEQARSADQAGHDFHEFITQLTEFIEQPPKEALASTSPESDNVIRLMTIHRAKGLEFPLVVVPDLDRHGKVDNHPAALDDELGPLVSLPAEDNGEKTATGMYLYAAAEQGAELEERIRLLYVATTRAADYLILSSSIEAYDKPRSDWMKLLGSRFNLETGELIAPLPAGWELPRVQVSPGPGSERPTVGKTRGPNLLELLDDARQLVAVGQVQAPAAVGSVPIDRRARRQFSFSRLTGQIIRSDVTFAPNVIPNDDQQPLIAVSARGLGSLVHDVLARIDFSAPGDIRDWCEHLAPNHVVENAGEAAGLAAEMIESFVASSQGRQLAQAGALHREIEFLLAWPPDKSNSNGCYLQGYIDCLYEDPSGAWHLIDYKTNNVSPADVENEAPKYEMQLYVYAIAAEQALGRSPQSLTLHFLRPGIKHDIPWNDTARETAIKLVNNAIAQHLTPNT